MRGSSFGPAGREAGRFTILETLGSGTGMDDLDGDGDLDLVFAGGGTIAPETGLVSGLTPGLYLNDGTGRFSNASDRLVSAAWRYSHGVVLGDYDLDGRQDLVLAAFGGANCCETGGTGLGPTRRLRRDGFPTPGRPPECSPM